MNFEKLPQSPRLDSDPYENLNLNLKALGRERCRAKFKFRPNLTKLRYGHHACRRFRTSAGLTKAKVIIKG